MRIVKILAGVLAVMLGVVIVAGIVLISLFDPNDYKDYLTDLVEERTGRELTIDDDIELSLFPWLAIETGGITVGSSPEFPEDSFATIASVSARVRVWPLLKRQVEIGTVVIEGIVLNLSRDESGRRNWDDLLERSESTAAQDNAAPSSDAARIERLAIEGIRIRDGRVLWRENNEIRYIVSELSLETGTINDNEPIDISLGLSVLDVESQSNLGLTLNGMTQLGAAPGLREIQAQLRLLDARGQERGRGGLDLNQIAIAADGAIDIGTGEFNASLIEPPMGPDVLDVSGGWNSARFDAATTSIGLTGLRMAVGGIETRWQINDRSVASEATLSGSVTINAAATAELFELAAIELPANVDATQLGPLSARADFDIAIAESTARLDGLQASMLGFELTGAAVLDADGNIDASLAIPRFQPNDSLRGLIAAFAPESMDVTAIASMALSTDIRRAAADGSTRLSGLQLDFGRGRLNGDIRFEPANGNRLSGSIATADLDPGLLVSLFPMLWPDNVGADEIGRFSLNSGFVYDQAADRITLNPLSLVAFGLTADGNLTINNLSTEAFNASGQAELDTFPPRAFLTRFGQPVPQTSDPNAFRSASVAARFSVDTANGEFDDIVVSLDDSRITGEFSVDNFQDPTYRFVLRADQVDVDRYLPPPADEVEDGERAAGDIELQTEPLEFLKLNGTATVGNLKLANMRFQQVSTRIDLGDGVAQLDQAHANLYDGEFDGSFRVDTTGEAPSMQLRGQATNLALAPLLTALLGDSDLSGVGVFDLDLTGTGATVTDNLRSASGTMSFSLRDGVINGFNLERTLCSVFNRSQSLAAPAAAAAQTRYTLIRAAADVSDGIAFSRELVASSAAMDISGTGRLTLADQRLDYDMKATLREAIAISGCESMNRLIGDSIPFTINGPLDGPEILPDFGEYLRDRIRDEAQDLLRERLEERLRNLL